MKSMFIVLVVTFVLAHVTAMTLSGRLEQCVSERTALIEETTK